MLNSPAHPRPKLRLSASALIHLLAGVACLFILGLNTAQGLRELRGIYRMKKIVPYSFPGHKFRGLEEIFKDVAYAGYYTDKNMNEFETGAQFAQAQLLLAPTILVLNDLSREYTLFDCSSLNVTFKKINEAGLIPLKKNQFGIVLAKRKP